MPTERFIRKKAIEKLQADGWVTWFAPKVKYQQTDIFGIIDLLAIKKKKMKKIQLTTLPNVSAKRKKITNFLKKNKVELSVEIWAWHSSKKIFRIEKINKV
ncbi:MAG: hypothetical protein Q8N73_00930 [bacterium]|nr:hypothetical protein [bacterium]